MKIVVFKNNSLAFVELEMKAAGILDFGTDLRNPNFAKMAEGAGPVRADRRNAGASPADDCSKL